ncbi:MAG: DUF469 family protein [Rubrivivax sp.]|nr:MAG: DUF469 family protein [Rubrivivax sp.]
MSWKRFSHVALAQAAYRFDSGPGHQHTKKATMAKTRSRRLRKKLRVGEFQQLGFLFEAELTQDADDEALVDAFLAQAITPNNLSFGGWATGGAIDKLGRQSVTEPERSAVLAWLTARPEVSALSATGLVDMWYSTQEAQQRTKLKG